jgi:DNA replication protein DnaC
MLTESTVNKLYEMRLTVMAKAFKDQMIDPNVSNLSFEDRFGLLVDQEWTSRKNNHLKNLIKQARFAEPGACTEDIEYHADRNLNQAQIARLSTCNFITERHNVILLGATGSGKTYIACALGMAAARNSLQVRYVRLPELLTELAIARGNGTYPRVIQQYKKPALLILDEWLLYPLRETEARDLFEITEARYKKASTIFCSQFDVPGWRDKIGNPILADSVCDRIVHDSYIIVIDCKESMRKRKGVKESEA